MRCPCLSNHSCSSVVQQCRPSHHSYPPVLLQDAKFGVIYFIYEPKNTEERQQQKYNQKKVVFTWNLKHVGIVFHWNYLFIFFNNKNQHNETLWFKNVGCLSDTGTGSINWKICPPPLLGAKIPTIVIWEEKYEKGWMRKKKEESRKKKRNGK